MGKSKTHEEFLSEVYNQVKDEYTVLEKYIGANNKILIRHNCNICDNYRWNVRPSDLLNGARCPICNKLSKTKSDSDFKQDIYDLVGDEYTVIEKYVNAQTKIKFRHNICGHEYKCKPNNFLYNNRRCPKCSGNMKKETKQFVEEVTNLAGGEYLVLGFYKNAKTKITIKHNKCGNTFEMEPTAFLRGNRCPICNNPRKTHEQFEYELKKLYGDEYKLLEEYKGCKTKIKMLHTVCNKVWNCIPTDFINGYSKCPKCSLENRKKSIAKFKEEFDLVSNKEYELLEKYKGSKKKIKVKHIMCGYEWNIDPHSFLKGTKCPNCANLRLAKERMYSHEEYVNIVNEISKDKYSILTKYIGANEPITVKCLKDNYVWSPMAGSFISTGCKCPKCSNSVKTKDTNYFKMELFELYANQYEVLTEYMGTKSKIILKHECGYIWRTTPSDILSGGNKCPNCNGGIKRKTTHDFKLQVFNLVADEYEVLGEYNKSHVKIEFKHNKCNNIFKMSPSTFLRGGRCLICNESKGETTIRETLNKNNINYCQQYTFDDCKDKKHLPFDFAIFKDEEKTQLKCLIEYDGEFHYKPIDGVGKLKYQQKHDYMKNEYCQKNNINLIRIPYWEFENIGEIMTKELQINN